MNSLLFSTYMQLVTPSDVPSAVSIETKICTINFQVSFFIIIHFSARPLVALYLKVKDFSLFTFHFSLNLLVAGTLIVVTATAGVVGRTAAARATPAGVVGRSAAGAVGVLVVLHLAAG